MLTLRCPNLNIVFRALSSPYIPYCGVWLISSTLLIVFTARLASFPPYLRVWLRLVDAVPRDNITSDAGTASATEALSSCDVIAVNSILSKICRRKDRSLLLPLSQKGNKIKAQNHCKKVTMSTYGQKNHVQLI